MELIKRKLLFILPIRTEKDLRKPLKIDKKSELEKSYFDKKEGIGYTLGRLSIGSCDFSTEDYTYVEEVDEALDTFDISHNKKATKVAF